MAASFPWQPATFLAPMEGVTSPPLRELLAQGGGIGVVCTEFVRVTANPLGQTMVKRHVVRPSVGVLSVQVMGNHIEQMADATRLVSDAGAHIVDINLGCPAPKAVRKGVGSAMLQDHLLLGRVLGAMRRSTTLPLSAKIRAGFDDASRVLEVARIVEDSGADFITVHPRRRVDFYSGVADWRIIRELSEALSIPVVGNGDIWYAADALRIKKETGCQAVMLGRPALRNPWIFQQIAALEAGTLPMRPVGDDVVQYVHKLHALFSAMHRHPNVPGLLKEQLRYLGRTLNDGGDFVRQACRKQTADELLGYVGEVFGGKPATSLDLSANGEGVERAGSALVEEPAEEQASASSVLKLGPRSRSHLISDVSPPPPAPSA